MKSALKKILVVDDEKSIVDVVKSYLENNDYQVYEAYDGKTALQLVDQASPSLIILDLMLPDMSGEAICQQIRSKSRVPIIMLTAKVAEEEVIQGLKIGADDYVTKPFSPRQLMARVEALLRRTVVEEIPASSLLSFNQEELIIDDLSREVRKNGQKISLTPNEYRILMVLVKYPQKVFTREELVVLALGDDFDGFDRTIDVHIKNLRQKLETDPKLPRYIITVHGIGYRFGGEKTDD